jgi:hypothetical protein
VSNGSASNNGRGLSWPGRLLLPLEQISNAELFRTATHHRSNPRKAKAARKAYVKRVQRTRERKLNRLNARVKSAGLFSSILDYIIPGRHP